MAMEIEYTDVDEAEPNWDITADDIDAADIVNGNGEHASSAADDGVGDDGMAEGFADAAAGAAVNQGGGAIDDDNTILEDDAELSEADMAAARERAEWLHDKELADAKEEHFNLAVKRSELENDLKEYRADEKAALKNLKNLIRRGPNYPQSKSKIESAVSSAVAGPSAIQVDDPTADQSWREIPTSEIISGLKGMGEKKAEAIIGLAPTLGDLEELRAQASLAYATFASVLPKGVGGGLADEIEERILTRISRHVLDRAAVDDGAEAAADELLAKLDEDEAAEPDAAQVE